MRSLRLVAGLTLAIAVLLFVCGDFTPYVSEPDRDVWVSPPSPTWQLLASVSVAVPFAAFSALLFALTGRLLSSLPLLRLALVTIPGLCALVYYYGPFKILLGGAPPYLVQYELPWGTDRLFVSAVCGAGLAAVAGTGVWACRVAFSDVVGLYERLLDPSKVEHAG